MIETEKSTALFNLAKTALSGTRNGSANGPASTATNVKTDSVDEVARLLQQETAKGGPLRATSSNGLTRAAVPPPPLLARASASRFSSPKFQSLFPRNARGKDLTTPFEQEGHSFVSYFVVQPDLSFAPNPIQLNPHLNKSASFDRSDRSIHSCLP